MARNGWFSESSNYPLTAIDERRGHGLWNAANTSPTAGPENFYEQATHQMCVSVDKLRGFAFCYPSKTIVQPVTVQKVFGPLRSPLECAHEGMLHGAFRCFHCNNGNMSQIATESYRF